MAAVPDNAGSKSGTGSTLGSAPDYPVLPDIAVPVDCRESRIPELDVVDAVFRSFVPGNAPLEPLLAGCRWLEGPVWFADQNLWLVSDIPNDRILRVTERAEWSVFRAGAGFPNGQTRDLQGRLLTCSNRYRGILRTELDGRVLLIASYYQGKPLNSPNDIVVAHDGAVWFSDPPYGIETDYEGEKAESVLPPSVYRLDPLTGVLTCMTSDFEGPNGLAFSPDGKRLYVAETGHQFAAKPRRFIRVFDVAETAGGPRLSGGHEFHKVDPGYADGFRCDTEGNVWTSAADGVHCLHPSGNLLGRIFTPGLVANLCFGGRRRSRLMLCMGREGYAMTVNRQGAQWP